MINVIIPIYNNDPRDLKRAVHSCLAQYKPVLPLVVDDHSDDYLSEQYHDICKKLNVAYQKLDKNGGPGVARQWGIDHGYNTDFVGFLDADDTLMPQYSTLLEKPITQEGLDIITSHIIHEGIVNVEDTHIDGTESLPWLHGKVYRKSFLKENNIRFLDDLRFNEDVYFNICAIFTTLKYATIDRQTYCWHYNVNSLTRKDDYWETRKKTNVEYCRMLARAINFVCEKGATRNIAPLFAWLYNAYQFQQNIDRSKIETIDVELIKQFSDNKKIAEEINKDKKKFMHMLTIRAHSGENDEPFHESLQYWWDTMEDLIE